MTPTKSVHPLSTSELLQTIDPQLIAEDDLRLSVETLLNLVEELNQKVTKLEKENQLLKDENNRLKGEQGKPDIKAKKKRNKNQNYSSEKERKIAHPTSKSRKNQNIKIDREEILDCDEDQLPKDVIFKGYEEVIVQDIKLVTDNIKFRKKKYYSPSTKKTYLSKLPPGYEGQFGPGIKSLVISLYYGGNMTQSKVSEFLSNIGISISTGQISNILIKNQNNFDQEQTEVYCAGFASTPWQHFDQTGARVGGENFTTNVICNPLYSIYLTTEKKDRLNVIKCLVSSSSLNFILNQESRKLLDGFGLPTKWKNALCKLPQETVLNEEEFNGLRPSRQRAKGKGQKVKMSFPLPQKGFNSPPSIRCRSSGGVQIPILTVKRPFAFCLYPFAFFLILF